MALIFMDGFDLYTGTADMTMQWNGGVNGDFTETGGRFGTGAFKNTNFAHYCAYTPASAMTEVWACFAVNVFGSANQGIFGFISSGGIEGSVGYSPSTSQIYVCRGNYGATVLGTATFSLNGGWHWVEIHYKLHGSAGIFELWVDGNELISVTGVNTSGAGQSTFTTIRMSADGTNNATAGYYDDFVLLDTTGSTNNGRPGDCRIETLKPSSDAGTNNGTLTSGSDHFAMVNESQNDADTTTITMTNTSGQEELFGFTSLSGAPASILAVKNTILTKKSDAGTCDLEAVLVSGGTQATGASFGLSTSYGVLSQIADLDPNTSAPWLYTSVNALQAGFKVP